MSVMNGRFFVLAALLVFVPLHVAQAIPPPDLIFSLSQSIMSVLGLLMASLIIAVTSLQMYIRNFLLTKTGRFIMYGLCAGIALLGVALLALYINQLRFDTWQSDVDQELRDVWQVYDAAYQAPDEQVARAELTSAAQEVTWAEFLKVADGGDYLVLDIRDSHAFAAGNFLDSVHIRLADLLHGRHEELEAYKDKPIYIVCYLGTTGAIAGDFLASQGFSELYLPQDGLRNTIKRDDVPFTGVTYPQHYEEMINRLSQAEVLAAVKRDALVIDLRSPQQYEEPTKPTADLEMFREFMTEPEIDTFLQTLDANRPYVFLCNSDASCYQGEMLLHDFYEHGLQAVGTYDSTKPDGKQWVLPAGFFE